MATPQLPYDAQFLVAIQIVISQEVVLSFVQIVRGQPSLSLLSSICQSAMMEMSLAGVAVKDMKYPEGLMKI